MDGVLQDTNKSRTKTVSLVLAILSLILGVFGIIITVSIGYIIGQVIGSGENLNIVLYIKLINVLTVIENIVKPLGIISGLIAVFLKGNRKALCLSAICLNFISIIYTLLLMVGWI